MGFLNQLWDETLAGPAPDKLRKYDSFSASHSNSAVSHPVTRTITILRTKSAMPNLSVEPPDSPAGSTSPSPPGTPLSPGSPTLEKRFVRRKYSAEDVHRTESISPNVYDWILMNALDR